MTSLIFVAACRLLFGTCGIYSLMGLNLGPLPWEGRVLATGLPGKSLGDIVCPGRFPELCVEVV